MIEDGSVSSKSSTTLSALVGYEFMPGIRAQVEILNVLNARVSDIDYFYASRLGGEPVSGVDDIHFHPAQPRSARLAIVVGF